MEYITSFSQKMQKMAELRSLPQELLGKNIGNGVSLDILLLAIHSLRASALFSLLIFLPTECGFQESGKCLFYLKKRQHCKCFFIIVLQLITFFFSFLIFLLKDNCFIEFCCFLSNLNMNQPQLYIYPLPFEPPSHLPPHPTPLG